MPTRLCALILFVAVTTLAAQETPTVRSQSSVVLVPTLVEDTEGRPIHGLRADDFLIEDDGVPQRVNLDDSPESQPISVVVAIQTGRRASREFPRIRGVSSMIGPLLEERGTRVAVVEFDSQVRQVTDLIHDSGAMGELKDLHPGDGGAAILDAVQFSVSLLAKEPEGRKKILLLVSEMRDYGSHVAKVDDVVSSIGKSNVMIYALAFSPALSQVLDTERGSNRDEAAWNAPVDLLAPILMARNAMKENVTRTIAQLSGGEYQVFTSHKAFEARMMDFTNHIHNRYILSFAPQRPGEGLHQIRVRLKSPPESVNVISRTSYWAGTDTAEER